MRLENKQNTRVELIDQRIVEYLRAQRLAVTRQLADIGDRAANCAARARLERKRDRLDKMLAKMLGTAPTFRNPGKASVAQMEAIGKAIRKMRGERGFSQHDLAEHLGIRQQSVADWEKGRNLTRVVAAWRLAELLGEHRQTQ